jgi:cytochrome bd ubiquinol oxidase subunit I
MDVLLLSRLQFAAAAFFHFLFVPLTLGLGLLVALMETAYVRTGNEDWRRLTRFWGKLFVINFAIGVVTGITLEFQFGTNWSRYAQYVGDIFGSLLAIEATVAFFLESTFLGVWIFGWNKLSPKLHVVCIWIVVLASNFSAYWILMANAWMQHPVGYTIVNGRAELKDFMAVITQWPGLVMICHTLCGAYILAGFFVMGVSAYHFLKARAGDATAQKNLPLFEKSFRLAAGFALLFALVEAGQGHLNGAEVAKRQPAKLAAMEAFWETKTNAPQYLFLIPGSNDAEKNVLEIGKIPSGLSLLAYHHADAEVKGLKSFPKADRPPVAPVFLAFRGMIGLGMLFIGMAGFAVFFRKRIQNTPRFLRAFILAIPLPYIAIELGWLVAEVGRQPWIVQGLMRTSDAVSTNISEGQVLVSLAGFVILYSVLGLIDFYLLAKFAKRGPEPTEKEA